MAYENENQNISSDHYYDMNGYSGGNEINSLPLAMAYIPNQVWRNMYSPEEGLECGTVFHELDMPFQMSQFCNQERGEWHD